MKQMLPRPSVSFLFGETKKAAPIKANKIRKAVFILHCSGFGYIPYINLLNQTLTKTQQAPSLVQSSLAEPIKSASKINQFNKGGVYLNIINIINKVRTALKVVEFTLLLKLSKILIPLYSILIKYKPIEPTNNGKK